MTMMMITTNDASSYETGIEKNGAKPEAVERIEK